MKKALMVGVLMMVGVLVAPGAVSAETNVTINNTGPDSVNKVNVGGGHKKAKKARRAARRHARVMNNNKVKVMNDTDQKAKSGNAKVKGNTKGGDATSGDATNTNRTNADVNVKNKNAKKGDCGCEGNGGGVDVVINNTGPDSKNIVKVAGQNGYGGGTKVKNNNKVKVMNDTYQKAKTGNAVVAHNTKGGDATSGDAKNINRTNADVNVKNKNGAKKDCGCNGGGDVNVTIKKTGPDSKNKVYVGGGIKCCGGTSVKNNNKVYVSNSTNQKAKTGKAVVKGNTKGGNATSGNATNSNGSTFSVNLNNM